MRYVAVCLGGLLRALPEVGPSIQKFLIEPLDADLFVSGPLEASADWIASLALFPTLTQVRLERENVTDFLRNSPEAEGWRAAAQVKGNWLGCLEDEGEEDMRRAGSGLCQMYSHRQCLQMVSDWEEKRGQYYDQIVYSRPDFHWLAPHLPLKFLPAGELHVVDGEDNGGINDRHWVMSRQMASYLLNSWDRLLDGSAARMLGPQTIPMMSTEIYFHYLMAHHGINKLVRRIPSTSFVACSNFHNRKYIDTSAQGLDDSRRLGDVSVRCQVGGAKYRHEYRHANGVADCKGDREWTWDTIWECWCAEKDREFVMHYMDYRLCLRAMLAVTNNSVRINFQDLARMQLEELQMVT